MNYTPFHVELHCAILRYTPCALDFSWGLWYFAILPYPFTFECAKLLTASTSAVEWYKSRAQTSILSEVIQILIHRYTPCTIDFSCGLLYFAIIIYPFTFEGSKHLAASTSAVEWYKSCAHISFQSYSNSYMYICANSRYK